MKKTAPLRWLMDTFCLHLRVQPGRLSFIFDANRVSRCDTPADVSDTKDIVFFFFSLSTLIVRIFHQLRMQDQDEIDVLVRLLCSFVSPLLFCLRCV